MLTWLTLVVILFEIWYAAAFLVAFAQTRERMLLMPVGQALLLLGAFGYVVYAAASNLPLNPVPMVLLLIAAMLVSLVWRRSPAGLVRFLKSYPRGTIDVLSFRRPATDLKRRVRTK